MRAPSWWSLGILAGAWLTTAAGAAEPARASEPVAVEESVAGAASEPPRVELRWTGPEDCPASSLGDAMRRLLEGAPAGDAILVEAEVEAHADAAGEDWRIVTTFEAGPGRSGSRTFRALSCRTVTQAAALAIVLAVDPTALDRFEGLPPSPSELPSEPPAELPAEPPAEPAAEPAPPPPGPESVPPPETHEADSLEPVALGPIVAADRPTEPALPSWQALVGVAGSIDGGALPGPGGGLAATIGAQRRHFRAELAGAHRFATRRASEVDPRAGGAFSQWAVGVRGCGVLRPATIAVEPMLCLGLEAGQTIGRGVGLLSPRTTRQPWLAPVAAAGLAWPVRPWLALTLRGAVGVPLMRQDFSITGLGVVHRLGPVRGEGLGGIELRWP